MITYNYVYKSDESLLDFIDGTGLDSMSNVLVRIHTSFSIFENATLATGPASIYDDEGNLLPGATLANNILEKIPSSVANPFVLMFFPLSYLEGESEDNPCFVISGEKALPFEVGFCGIYAKLV